MALSEANLLTICEIFEEVTKPDLDAQVTWMGSRLTTAVQTAIETNITRWSAGAGNKTTQLYPLEANKGVKTQPDVARNQIRQRIAVLLERPDWGTGGSGGNYLARG